MKFKINKVLVKTSIALSSLSLLAFSNIALSDTVVVQAESFVNAGGTFADGSPSQPSPVNIYSVNGVSAISYVNAGDFVDFDVNVQGGVYDVEYLVGTSVASNANVEFLVNENGAWVSQGTVAVPMGQWDNFQLLAPNHQVSLPAGASQVRLHAIGANWQWNMDQFSLTSVSTSPPSGQSPYATHNIPGVIQVEDFDNGGQGVAYNDTNTGNTGGTYRAAEGVDIQATSDSGGGNNVGWVANGEWLEYTVNNVAAGNYDIDFRVATNSNAAGKSVRVLLGNTDLGTVNLSGTGGWQSWATVSLNNVALIGAASQVLRLEMIGGDFNVNWVEFTQTNTPPPTGSIYMEPPVSIPASRQIKKSEVWYTYPQNRNLAGYGDFGATGSFWGHPPNTNFYDDTTINSWVDLVQGYRDVGLEYTARGEFDWAWKWFIEYENDPTDDWVRDMNNNVVSWDFGPNDPTYQGFEAGWVSNHSPVFVDWLKSQIDQIFKGNISYFMFDSQTSSTRSTDLNQFGGDFSIHAMNAFRTYMGNNYTTAELSAKGISDINAFNYRDFLVNEGYTHTSFMAAANTISGGVPLIDDFLYFNREVFNEKMAVVLDYARSKDPTIEIGATTAVTEARGYLFDDNITFLAGEHAVAAAQFTTEMPINIIAHLKAAESVDKTLVYFTYPWEFGNLQTRGAPRQARGWIAQSYAMGAIFSIPAAVWTGASGVWNIPADNYRDIYQFIGNNTVLFDGYEEYSKVGLVSAMGSYLDATWIDGSGTMHGSIRELIESNLNFDLLIFGDAGRPVVPTAQDFARYDTILVDGDRSYLTAAQNTVLNAYSGKTLDLSKASDDAAINALKNSNISVSVNGSAADDAITAVSRVHENNGNAPYVVHLLNRPLNPADGTTPVLNNVSVAIPQGYFDESITGATLHFPSGASYPLGLSSNAAGDTVLDLSGLGVWGLLELSH